MNLRIRNRILLLFAALFFISGLRAQDSLSYGKPLDLPMLLSATFGELRPGHFHAGLDIKTNGKTGYKVYAIADGYVYRIKVQRGGYGKVVYIKHPDGKISVYAHLSDFAGDLATYIKRKQYEKQRFFLELRLNENLFPVRKGQVIGYSGNTGGSFGPHLHFEIRDGEAYPINPMRLGYTVPDTMAPRIVRLWVYPLADTSSVAGTGEPVEAIVAVKGKREYHYQGLAAYGATGLGIQAFDRQNNTWNKNGLYRVEMWVNGIKTYETRMDRISYGLNRRINLLIDYPAYVRRHQYIQRLWKHPKAKLPVFKQLVHRGVIRVEDGKQYAIRIVLSDFNGNKTTLHLNLTGKKSLRRTPVEKTETGPVMSWNRQTIWQGENIKVVIPRYAVYDSLHLHTREYLNGFEVGDPEIPLNKRITVKFSLKNIRPGWKRYAYLTRQHPRNGKRYFATARKERDSLVLSTYNFGTYFVDYDSIVPVISKLNIKNNQWVNRYRFLRFRVSDNKTGVADVKAYIDEKWILLDWDPKTGRVVYDFNDLPLEGSKHNLRIIVTDRVGNRKIKLITFFRKE